jgi:hypothetical protein
MSKPTPSSPRPSPSTRCASPAAPAPTARPRRCPRRLLRLPQREVERVLLQPGAFGVLALVHRVEPATRERAVARVAAHAEVDVAAAEVGVIAPEQRLDLLDDRADRLARQRLVVGASEAEPLGVGEVGGRHRRRQLDARAALRGGVDLVVDVGHVDHQADLEAACSRNRFSRLKTTNGRALPMWMRE